jgi:hypothetical protein
MIMLILVGWRSLLQIVQGPTRMQTNIPLHGAELSDAECGCAMQSANKLALALVTQTGPSLLELNCKSNSVPAALPAVS